MKKFAAIFLALLVILSLCACENGAEKLISAYDDAMSVAEEAEKYSSEQQSAVDEGTPESDEKQESSAESEPEISVDEDGSYFSKDEVALYIHTYGKLPQNFITKAEAKKLGWEGGSVEAYAEGKAIGGDYFGNYDGLLAEAEGRKYTECDINTNGKSKRGAERIVFSNDGLVYYTADHYESFELLYGG